MAKFKYIAEDKTRTRKEGFRKADSESEVTEWIYDSGLKPISIGEVRPKKKAEKPTTQDTAKIFITLAEVIKEKANNCSPLENVSVAEANNRKEELQRSYLIDRLSVEALTKRTKKHLDKDLQETPALLGNDYFTGMINLSDHCRDCAAKLTGKTNDTDNGSVIYEYDPHSRTLTCKANDKEYEFNPSQGTAVKMLYEAWKSPDKVGVLEKDIGGAVDSTATPFRLRNLFRISGKYNQAWTDKIIERFGKGSYRLKTFK